MQSGIKSNNVMTLQESSFTRELNDLKRGLRELQIAIPESSFHLFQRYLGLLHEYRSRVHLLSRGDYGFIVQRHVLVSLMSLSLIKRCVSICDVGAGAGFPSIPLSICLPTAHFTLFESKVKKAEFLQGVVAKLPLANVSVTLARAESYDEAKFEVVLLRAVGKIRELAKTVDRLLEPHGCAIFYKTEHVDKEIQQARRILEKRQFSVQVERLRTPIVQQPLSLVILRKKA